MQSFTCALSRTRGFTLIEVMISLAILAISLTALASSIFSLQNGRQLINENRAATSVAQAVLERIQGEAWDRIGRVPATWHRRETPTKDVTRFVEEYSDPDTLDDFRHHPLTDEPSGLNLYQYVQYGSDPDRDGVFTPSPMSMDDLARDDWGLPYVTNGQRSAFNTSDSASSGPAVGAFPAEIINKYNTHERYNWLQFVGILDKPSGLNNLRVYVEYYRAEVMQNAPDYQTWLDQSDDDLNILDQSHNIMDLTELDELNAKSIVIRVNVVWTRRNGREANHELFVARRQ